MKKRLYFIGIGCAILYSIGLLFKALHWPGASIIIYSATFLLCFVYLPIKLVLDYRISESRTERFYYIIRFISFFLFPLAFTFKIMQLPGAGAFLALIIPLLPALLLTYILLWIYNREKITTFTSGFVIILFTFSLMFFLMRTMVTKDSGNAYWVLTEQSEKHAAGIKASNEVIIKSITDIETKADQDLIDVAFNIHTESYSLLSYLDSMKNEFASYCSGVSYEEFRNQSYNGMNVDLSGEFFGTLGHGHGVNIKSRIEEYKLFINEELLEYNIKNQISDIYLNTDKITGSDGISWAWEAYYFEHVVVNFTFAFISSLEQQIASIENQILNSLLIQSDISEMSALIQSISSIEAEKAIAEMELELTRNKQEQTIKNLKNEATEAKFAQQRILIVAAFIGIGFVLILLIISTRAFFKKLKDAKKLGQQKKEIEKTHFEISASIDYAQRLQKSILPLESKLNGIIKDKFVYFKPKDKVSGDFYWWTNIEEHTIVTAADCTGHGVPGAFMSMLGISLLREIVNKEYITHPGVILRKLRKEVIRILNQKGEIGEQKDGMDIAVISINNETLECQYAGANNPLYLIRNKELIEYKADRMPIAIYQRMDNFSTHEIQLQKNDQLYMFSDGFADQFGGPKGKKYKYKPFKNLLSDKSELPLENQMEELSTAFNRWKGDCEQIDDVVVVGLKV